MIYPALDATTEHVYVNIGPQLGDGSGSSRVNAMGVTSINNYFYLVRFYDMVANKRHRIVHIVGLDSIKDNRAGDQGNPTLLVNQDYFYDIYYEVDGLYGSYGCALPFVRVYNLHATLITHGTSHATGQQVYINPIIENTFSNTSSPVVSVYGTGSIARGQMHLINPKIVNTGSAFKLRRLTTATFINELHIYGGTVIGKNFTSSGPLVDYSSNNGEKVFLYNTAIHLDNASANIVAPANGYVDGANIPQIAFNNCTFNSSSVNVDSKTTLTNIITGALDEDVFVNYDSGNYLAASGIYSNSGLDLTTLPDYDWTDYAEWNIGLRETEPLPGAIIVNSVSSVLGANTLRAGVTVTISLTGDIGDTAGTILLKNTLQTSQLSLTITSWDNVTKQITCTVPESFNVRFNDSDDLLFITRADGEPLSPYGGIIYLAPVGTQTVLGELYSSQEGSIFFGAITPPTGSYQIQWRDPDSTGAIILADGTIESIDADGTIFVRVYDETDSTIGNEVAFNLTTSNVPQEIRPNLDFSTTAIKLATVPKYSTAYLNGQRFGEQPQIRVSTTRPTTNQRLQLTGTFASNQSVSLRTNGFYSFGDIGPNLIMYMDSADLPLGQLDDLSIIEKGVGTTISYQSTNTERFQVVSVPEMPTGKGIVNGAIGSELNATSTPRMEVSHNLHPRGFESRSTYWPAANRDLAIPYLLEQTGPVGTRTWQEKGIWNMADFQDGSADTDFFGASNRGWEGSAFGGPGLVLSNSVPTRYEHGGVVNSTHPQNAVEPEPVSYDYLFDQYAANQLARGYAQLRIWCASRGNYSTVTRNDVQLAVPTGVTRYINSYTYPGFMRGYNVDLGFNRYDDYIYKANGAGAACRVLITNHSDFTQASIKRICLVEDWSRFEINFTVKGGGFNLAVPTGLYINIIGIDGNQITSALITDLLGG